MRRIRIGDKLYDELYSKYGSSAPKESAAVWIGRLSEHVNRLMGYNDELETCLSEILIYAAAGNQKKLNSSLRDAIERFPELVGIDYSS